MLQRALALALLTCCGAMVLYCSLRAKLPPLVTIQGTILDAASMKPLANATVSSPGNNTTSSNVDGHYQIRVPVGLRQLTFNASDHAKVQKVVVIRKPDVQIVLDVLIPKTTATLPKVLAADRGSRLNAEGQELSADVAGNSSISLADEYGNNDTLLSLQPGRIRTHSPVWVDSRAILYGREGVLHDRKNAVQLGVFRYDLESERIDQVASQIATRFLDLSKDRQSLLLADQKALYTMGFPGQNNSPRLIFRVESDHGYLLSAAWGPKDRIYFTVDDSIPLDDRHALTRSRIASVNADGTDLDAGWQRAEDYSYRYPTLGLEGDILFSRFSLDGKEQTLWTQNPGTSRPRPLGIQGLRAVDDDSERHRFYYIYQGDLHLKDTKAGSDWVILNSVKEADYRR